MLRDQLDDFFLADGHVAIQSSKKVITAAEQRQSVDLPLIEMLSDERAGQAFEELVCPLVKDMVVVLSKGEHCWV